jgi:hypothetical protein
MIKKQKQKQIAIIRMRTESDIKIKWNKIMINKVKNKINQDKDKKIAIKRMKIKYNRWKKIWRMMKLKNNSSFINYFK